MQTNNPTKMPRIIGVEKPAASRGGPTVLRRLSEGDEHAILCDYYDSLMPVERVMNSRWLIINSAQRRATASAQRSLEA